MNFLEGREKIAFLRKKLNISTEELATENLTKDYLQLLESGNSIISKDVSKLLICRFKQIALEKELNLDIELDENFFLRTKEEEATKYCYRHLNTTSSLDELNTLLNISNEYNLDSLKIKIYIKMADINIDNNNYEIALNTCFIALKLLKNSNSDDYSLYPYLYKNIGRCNYYLLDYHSAIIFFNKAKDKAKELNLSDILNKSIYNLAICYMNIKQYDISIETMQLFMDTFNKQNLTTEDYNSYIYAKSLQISCYALKGNIAYAIHSLENLIEDTTNIENKVLAHLYTNLASLYSENNQLDKATTFYEAAQKIRAKIDTKNLAHTLIENASFYIKKDLNEEALRMLSQGIAYAKENNDTKYLVKGYDLTKSIYIKLDLDEKAEETLKNILKNTNDTVITIKAYNDLIKLYAKHNNFEKVLEYTSKMDFALKHIA